MKRILIRAIILICTLSCIYSVAHARGGALNDPGRDHSPIYRIYETDSIGTIRGDRPGYAVVPERGRGRLNAYESRPRSSGVYGTDSIGTIKGDRPVGTLRR